MASNQSDMLSISEPPDTLGDATKLAQLDAQLAVLAAQHAELLNITLLKRAAIAPWKKMPNEILQRIFCSAKPTGIPASLPFLRTEAPMQLTQVCSRWRAVAHDTPAIWQDLSCSVYLPPDRYEREATTAFIQSWISRAAYVPLSIFTAPANLGPNKSMSDPRNVLPSFFGGTMRSSLRPHSDGGIQFEPWWLMAGKFNFIKDIIIPNSSKIRHLCITFPSYYRHTTAFLQQTTDFHLLEDLVLDFPNRAFFESGLPSTHIFTLFQNAPLRKLRMRSFQMSSTQLLINWAHLTHFEVGMIDCTTFLEIFGQMTSLQSCKTLLQASPVVTFNLPGAAGNLHPFPNFNPNPPPIITPAMIMANANHLNPPPNFQNLVNAAANANPTNAPMNVNPPTFGPINAAANPNAVNINGNFNLVNVAPNGLAFQFHLNQPPTPISFPPISIPSLHTLDLMASFGTSFPSLPEMDFPNLKSLALESPDNSLLDLITTILRTTISLSKFRAATRGFSQQSQPLATVLNTPELSQITHLSLAMSPPHEEEFEAFLAIGEGRMLPHLETFEYDGLMSETTLLMLIIPKGFSECDMINPEVRSRLDAEGVAPFRKVTIRGCDARLMEAPGLQMIQEMVGKDRLVMEMAEKEQWAKVNQIEWDVDE